MIEEFCLWLLNERIMRKMCFVLVGLIFLDLCITTPMAVAYGLGESSPMHVAGYKHFGLNYYFVIGPIFMLIIFGFISLAEWLSYKTYKYFGTISLAVIINVALIVFLTFVILDFATAVVNNIYLVYYVHTIKHLSIVLEV